MPPLTQREMTGAEHIETKRRVGHEIDALHRDSLFAFSAILSSERCDPRDAAMFAHLVQSAIAHYDIKPVDLAERFGVNLSTVGRWASGKNAPHVMMRPVIIDWIQKTVEKIARGLDETAIASHETPGSVATERQRALP